MGVVLAPKHMSLANESKPDSRPGRHCVDLLRCLQNSACYSPMRIFLVVWLSYHTNSGFVQYNRDFLQKPAGEHRRKRVLPRRVSLCVEIRFIPRRRCQPRELRRPMPHRLLPSPPAARQWARPRYRLDALGLCLVVVVGAGQHHHLIVLAQTHDPDTGAVAALDGDLVGVQADDDAS